MSDQPQFPSNAKWDRCAVWKARSLDEGNLSETSTLDLRVFGPEDVNTYLPLLKKSPSAIIAPLHCWDNEAASAIICSDPHLRHIALCGVWNAKMSNAIASFAYITYLDMSNMQIHAGNLKTMIPAFSSLAHLSYLDVSYNPIRSKGVDGLAKMLSPLRCLNYLDVSHCQLSPKPPTSKSAPDLSGFSKSLSALTQLTHLNLSGNYLLRGPGCKKMGVALHHLTQLTHLDVRWNELDDPGCEDLIQEMGPLPCLHTFLLSENVHVTEWGCRALVPLLTVPTLRYLEARNINGIPLQDVNHLTHLDIQTTSEQNNEFGAFLLTQTNLKTLKLSAEYMADFESIGRFLHQAQLTRLEITTQMDNNLEVVSELNMTTLTHIALERCEICNIHMQTLAANGPQLTQLQSLSLYGNGTISNSSIPGLSKLLSYTSLLTHLNIGRCGFVPSASTGLAQCLSPLTQLRFLSLELTHFNGTVHHVLQAISELTLLEDLNLAGTCSTGKDLGPMLQQLTNLTWLSLSQNGMKTKCGKWIAPSLCLLTRLTYLDLSLNAFCTKGMLPIVASLAQLSHLRELNFRNCYFDEKLAKPLSKCMPNWKLLEELNFEGNMLNARAIKVMTDSFAHLQSLHTLLLHHNRLDAKAAQLLAKMLPLAPCLTLVDLGNNKDLTNADLADLKAVWDDDYYFNNLVIRRK